MDPSNPASKYARHFIIFKDGCAEDWVKWLMAYREVETWMTLKGPADKSKMVRTLLKGQALLYFEHHLKRRLDAEDAELPDKMLLELVLCDVGLEYIPKCAIRVQKYYIRRGLFLGQNISLQSLSFSLKKQLNTKVHNSKKRKLESLLSTEINLTTSSDEDENYVPFFSSLNRAKASKVAKASHPISELVVSLQTNNEKHLLRALADTGANSSVILEVYTSKQFIKTDKSNKTTWSTMGGQFTTDKAGLVTFLLPEFNLKKQIIWKFHVYDGSKPSNTYGIFIGRDLLGKLGIILNFNDKTVIWDTDTIPMKDRGTLNAQETLVEVYFASTEPQSLVDEFSCSSKILDVEHKPAIFEEVTQMCDNLNSEEQHH